LRGIEGVWVGMERREFLKRSGAVVMAGGLAGRGAEGAMPELIRGENAKVGADFQLTRILPDAKASYRSSVIEGFCSKQSVKAGEVLEVFVSLKPAGSFLLEVFRMGYYGGAGARLMGTYGPFEGKTQAVPVMGENRLMECRWEASVRLTVPEEWVSGVYLGRLTTVPGAEDKPYWQSYVIFVVKDDRPADVLFK
jgi:hypothetical protein